MHPAMIVFIVVGVILGAIFFLGIVAAIAVPNLLNAIDRGKQQRTMADLRSIATAIEAYAVDNDFYPTALDIDELESVLEPVYIRNIPETDGWGNRLIYLPGEPPGSGYRIRSFGKDGVAEAVPRGGPTGDFDCDIVFIDGQFTQWPERTQQ